MNDDEVLLSFVRALAATTNLHWAVYYDPKAGKVLSVGVHEKKKTDAAVTNAVSRPTADSDKKRRFRVYASYPPAMKELKLAVAADAGQIIFPDDADKVFTQSTEGSRPQPGLPKVGGHVVIEGLPEIVEGDAFKKACDYKGFLGEVKKLSARSKFLVALLEASSAPVGGAVEPKKPTTTKYGKPHPENRAAPIAKPRPGVPISVAKGDDYGTLGTFVNLDGDSTSPAFLTNVHVVRAAMADVFCPAYFEGKNKGNCKVIGNASDTRFGDSALDAMVVMPVDKLAFSIEIDVDTDGGPVKLKHAKIIEPKKGMWVWKMGATTGFTIGYVSDVSPDGINVTHAPGPKLEEWKNLVAQAGFNVEAIPSPPPLCDGGDSGSVWAEVGTNCAVGLHRRSTGEGPNQMATATRMDAIKKKFKVFVRT